MVIDFELSSIEILCAFSQVGCVLHLFGKMNLDFVKYRYGYWFSLSFSRILGIHLCISHQAYHVNQRH